MKKIPMRKCVVTQEQLPKKELIRVVRTPEQQVVIDSTGRTNGRGAYLKKDLAAIELAKRKKRWPGHWNVKFLMPSMNS